MVPKTHSQLEYLAALQDDPQLDFWTDIGLNRTVYIMLTPDLAKSKNFGLALSPKVVIGNVQELINMEKSQKPMKRSSKMTWDDYYSYEEAMHALF